MIMTWMISAACAVSSSLIIALFVFLLDWLIHKTNAGIIISIIVGMVMATFVWHMTIFG